MKWRLWSAYSVLGTAKHAIKVSYYDDRPRDPGLSGSSLSRMLASTATADCPTCGATAHRPLCACSSLHDLSRAPFPISEPLGPRSLTSVSGGVEAASGGVIWARWSGRVPEREGSAVAAGNWAAGGSGRVWRRWPSGGRGDLCLVTRANAELDFSPILWRSFLCCCF